MLEKNIGQLSRRELKNKRQIELLEKMPKNSVCAEVGIWSGEFTEKILRVVKPKKLYLIDPWEFHKEEGYERAWYGGRKAKNQDDMEKIYHSVRERFEPEIKSGQIIILRGFSEQTLEKFETASLDWIYIDGNHKYEFVKKDLSSSLDKVKRGGFITGDDYREGGWFNGGVKKAVDEFVDKKLATKVQIVKDQFILKFERDT